MPSNPTVWIVLIIAAAIIVGLMVWKGIGGTFARGKLKVTLHDAPKAAPEVRVAEGLRTEGGKVGNITGVKAAGTDTPAASKVDVANEASFSKTNVGDITGVDQTGGGGLLPRARKREK